MAKRSTKKEKTPSRIGREVFVNTLATIADQHSMDAYGIAQDHKHLGIVGKKFLDLLEKSDEECQKNAMSLARVAEMRRRQNLREMYIGYNREACLEGFKFWLLIGDPEMDPSLGSSSLRPEIRFWHKYGHPFPVVRWLATQAYVFAEVKQFLIQTLPDGFVMTDERLRGLIKNGRDWVLNNAVSDKMVSDLIRPGSDSVLVQILDDLD